MNKTILVTTALILAVATSGCTYNTGKETTIATTTGNNGSNEKENILTTMTPSQKREVNMFLSNFSEASYLGCEKDDYDASAQLWFVYTHNLLNGNYKSIITNGKRNFLGITTDMVDTTLNRFFGSTIPHETPAGYYNQWIYENGVFYIPAASGESYSYFTVAENMTRNNDGTNTVDFSVYFDTKYMHEKPPVDWYITTPEQAKTTAHYKFCYKGTAVIKAKKINNSDTYELVSYKRNDNQ